MALVHRVSKAAKAISPRYAGIDSVFQLDSVTVPNADVRCYNFDDVRDILLLSSITVSDECLRATINYFVAFLSTEGKFSIQVRIILLLICQLDLYYLN